MSRCRSGVRRDKRDKCLRHVPCPARLVRIWLRKNQFQKCPVSRSFYHRHTQPRSDTAHSLEGVTHEIQHRYTGPQRSGASGGGRPRPLGDCIREFTKLERWRELRKAEGAGSQSETKGIQDVEFSGSAAKSFFIKRFAS